MVIHYCPLCNKEFNKKSTYDYHINNKKNPCVNEKVQLSTYKNENPEKNPENPENIDMTVKELHFKMPNICKEFVCKNCNKMFTRKDNLKVHIEQYCKKIGVARSNIVGMENIKITNEIVTMSSSTFNSMVENYKNLNNVLNHIVKKNNEPDIVKKKKKKARIPQTLRFMVWEKYIGKHNESKCLCCKNSTISITNFDCGHIVSDKDGGKIHIDNLKPICRTCNLSMGSTNMNEFCEKYGF